MQRPAIVFASLLVLLVPIGAVRSENWPQFRGPTGQGHYAGKGLPTEWSAAKNVAWKQAIAGLGWSSPIVWEGRIYLTTAVPVEGSKDQSLRALCLDAAKGEVLWSKEVFRQDSETAPRPHPKNSHASPSPVTDGKRLCVHFGHQGTAALDLGGKILWRNTELGYAPVHGNGGTPILVDDKLVFSTDGSDKQFLVALNTVDGAVAWKTERRSEALKKFSFSTPLLITVNGKRQIISPTSDAVIAYDTGGKEIWRAKYDGYSVVPRPAFGHGLIFLGTGYERPQVLTVRADGTGDVTDTHIAWSTAKGAPLTPSPLLLGEELYVIADHGIASCFDAKTGKVHWQERLEGSFSASPLYAEGKIYLTSEEGTTTVIRAGKKFERLAENAIAERTFASLAAADGAIYLRTEGHVYRIQRK